MVLRSIILVGLALASLSTDAIAQRWAQVTLPTPYDQGYYLDIYFLPNNPLYGWACDNDSGYVVRTTNGGQTWSGTRAGAVGQFCHLEYIQFLDQQYGFCSGPCGAFRSTDGGASWIAITLPANVSSIWGGWFRSAKVGWILGGNCGHAQFCRTDDGGLNFTVFEDTTITRSNLSDALWMPDMTTGVVYAIGNGTLWKSTDDGFTWGVVSYTGTSSPWHEEIARSGNSFCIASAQSNCPGGGFTGGGIRFSTNAGSSWTEKTFQYDVFGTFLLDESRAWLSGWHATVKYSSDKGVTWNDRTCGIGTRNMDDIFFQNDTTGWVVGDGIFHLAPPLRTLSKNSMTFNNVCPDSSKYDTVWVENINFFDSPWELKFIGPEDYLFRVANIVPTPLPACSRVMVLVEYRAKIPGAHSASLVINIQNPDTTLVVNLTGSRRNASAIPTDTLVQFNARVGTVTDKLLLWRGIGTSNEQIVDVVRVSGDTTIHFVATLPLVIPPAPVTQTIIRAVPRDTGWVTARFRVRLAPCMRDTFITVRVYGESPIFNSIAQAAIDAACSLIDTLKIPVWNTGNIPLSLNALRIQSTGQLAFALIGFTSGKTSLPNVIPVGGSDTVLVEYRSQTGDDIAVLTIDNDDFSQTRGNKRSWNIDLRGLSQRPQPVVRKTVIELGTVCEGAIVDTLYYVDNEGARLFTASATASTTRITGLSTGQITVTPTSTRSVRFRWTAPVRGEVFDTIRVRIQPCDSIVYVVIHAKVITGGIAIAPSPVVDSTLVGGTLTRNVVIRPVSGQSVTITAITYNPSAPDLVVNIPTTPIALGPTDSAVVVFTWNPKTVTRVRGILQITSQGNCVAQSSVDVDLKSLSNDVVYTPTSLTYLVQCTKNLKLDSVRIESRATSNLTLRVPTIVESGTAFIVVRPTTDVVLAPGAVAYAVVSYDPTIAEFSAGTMRFVIDPAGESIDIPLAGRFDNTTLDLPVAALDYDTVGVCDPLITKTVDIINNGNVDETVDVDMSAAPPGFSVPTQNFIVAARSTSTVSIICNPSQLNSGTSQGDILFRGQICKVVASVNVKAELVGGRLQMSPDPVNAGTVVLGNSALRTVTITNPTAIARTIVQLSVEPPSPDWSIVGSADGIVVDQSAPLLVDVRFTPTVSGNRNATLRLIDAERCTTQSTIALHGNGQDPGVPPQHVVTLRLDEYRVPPSTYMNIPVRWVGDIQPAIIDTLRFSVTFSDLHFLVDSIHAGDLVDATEESEYTPGHANFTITSAGSQFGQSGIIAVLAGIANPAIPDSTFLSFVDMSVASVEPVSVVNDDGLLVIDACGPRNMILHKSPTSVRVMPPQPIADVLRLQVQAPYTQHIHLTLVDAIGNYVSDLGDYEVVSGETLLTIRMPDIASGVYGIMMQTDYGGVFNTMQSVVR